MNDDTTRVQVRITTASDSLTPSDRWDHFLARLGVRRGQHRVSPGLYGLNQPTARSPVFVTANYRLSFDALRSALSGMDAYILVLDTEGINVWCAAGKGTFGTDELVRQVETTALGDTVSHRELILPQLGAPGVAAHEVKKRCGFRVRYGPVRAADLRAYLESGRATPEMRRVRFELRDRLVLIPVELVRGLVPTLIAALVVFFVGGLWSSLAVASAILAGLVLFPMLLPWLPTRDFSSKGFVIGVVVALPFALRSAFGAGDRAPWMQAAAALSYLLPLPPVTAYLALNFTGSTTFTSRTGVRREIFRYIPTMAWMLGAGLVLIIGLAVLRLVRGV